MKNTKYHKELGAIIGRHAELDGESPAIIEAVSFFTATSQNIRVPNVYTPSLCVIAQGSKQIYLEKELYHYATNNFLIVSVDLPVVGQITKASPAEPYLCLKIDLDLQLFAELLLQMEPPDQKILSQKRGLFVGTLNETLAEAVLRLARLLDEPEHIPVLAPIMLRELHYRLLCSEYAQTIAHLSLKGTKMEGIATAIRRMTAQLSEPQSIESLATLAGMSISSFHSHFKDVTAMSPIQYLKRLRLIKARQLMLLDCHNASKTAYAVGYESPSQFNREYARFFGTPPATDIKNLRALTLKHA